MLRRPRSCVRRPSEQEAAVTTRDDAVRRERGLSSAEAAELLRVEGPNEVAPARPRTLPTRIGLQIVDPMILLLCGAFVVVCLLGDFSDAIIIAAVVVLNTTLGVAQELRAERAIAALDEMAAPLAIDVTRLNVPPAVATHAALNPPVTAGNRLLR